MSGNDGVHMNYHDRQGTIDGLRALADALEADPDLPVPYIAGASWGVHGIAADKVPAEIARVSRLVPVARWDKKVDDGYYRLNALLGALPVEVWGYRNEVCTRVVTGTRVVAEKVPTGFETVTKTVEDVEWVCSPLLAERAS